jgi:hypothetical protein
LGLPAGLSSTESGQRPNIRQAFQTADHTDDCFRLSLDHFAKAAQSGNFVATSESAHQAVPIGPVTLVIKQTATELSIETRRSDTDKSQIHSETLTYKLDGSESTVAGTDGTPIKSQAHWKGTKLVTATMRNFSS